MYWLIAQLNKAFIQNDSEKKFKEEFFLAVKIPIVVYVLQIEHLFRVPPAIYEELCTIIKRKLDTRVLWYTWTLTFFFAFIYFS